MTVSTPSSAIFLTVLSLIALEKDRYWMAPDGLSLSAGPFVAALEYATGKTATVVGKPSEAFFDLALEDMGLCRDQVAMIGDDIITDTGGAQKAGHAGDPREDGKIPRGCRYPLCGQT